MLEPDPWPELADRYTAGMDVTGRVMRIIDRGAIVDVGEGIEGFIPTQQLGIDEAIRGPDLVAPRARRPRHRARDPAGLALDRAAPTWLSRVSAR